MIKQTIFVLVPDCRSLLTPQAIRATLILEIDGQPLTVAALVFERKTKMPCLGPYGFEELRKRELDSIRTGKQDPYPICTDNLEILLCSACRSLEERNFDFETNPALSIFWDKHKKKDQARLEAEAKEKLERTRCLELCDKSPTFLTREEKKLLRKYKYL